MAVTAHQFAQAKQVQDAAIQDLTQAVRLVAGPGTGKSFVIEGRVAWLIQQQNVAPSSIIALSFTRAAAKDLERRIVNKGASLGIQNIDEVRVSTLHSLALYILRRSGNLAQYPTDPTILDDWEMDNVFDKEFGKASNTTKTRANEVRRDHEAYWSTLMWNPANLPPVKNPVTANERTAFDGYYASRTQAYSCVLPGEVIRTCVDSILGGHINPVAELGVEHVIIDEVQDLNPCDFEFIDILITRGVSVFVCGDDDQSIYSFRYAFPQGIQGFVAKYPFASDHILTHCFRCSVDILSAASNVLVQYSALGRIQKNLTSVYAASNPVNPGFISGNRFQTAASESAYIANSCVELIRNGISASDIMILLPNKRALLSNVCQALTAQQVPFDANLRDVFKDSNEGRFLLSLLRILSNSNDYVAHRVLLGTRSGVGEATTFSVTDKVIANNLNYRDIFYNPLPNQVFVGRELSAISSASANINALNGWSLTDTLQNRSADIDALILSNFSPHQVTNWQQYSAAFPSTMQLSELKEFLETDSEITRATILSTVLLRANPQLNQPGQANPLDKVKVMSFHSSKGLDAQVVFIPGLEEDIFPTVRTKHAPGLLLENARLFYVGITRAKSACILSYSTRRSVNGVGTAMAASRFAQATSIVFTNQVSNRLSAAEISSIQYAMANR